MHTVEILQYSRRWCRQLMTFVKQMDFRFIHFLPVYFMHVFRMWFHCPVQTAELCMTIPSFALWLAKFCQIASYNFKWLIQGKHFLRRNWVWMHWVPFSVSTWVFLPVSGIMFKVYIRELKYYVFLIKWKQQSKDIRVLLKYINFYFIIIFHWV